jgi:hypothetical protein
LPPPTHKFHKTFCGKKKLCIFAWKSNMGEIEKELSVEELLVSFGEVAGR